MKKLLPITLLAIALTTLLFFWEKNNFQTAKQDISKNEISQLPAPTELEENEGEEENQAAREAWFEQMHSAAPNTDWRAIEARTRYQRHLKRAAATHAGSYRGGEETLADGNLMGEWKERGSNNQAGRVVATEYDAAADKIWLISDGGTLFKGSRDGSDWEVVNDDLRFNDNFLKVIPHDGGRRWLAFVEKVPHYSDDEGITWLPASGVNYTNGNFESPVILDDSTHTFYVLQNVEYWDDINLLQSTDQGETFSVIATFPTNVFRQFKLSSPHNSDLLYLAQRENGNQISLYQVNDTQLELVSETGITVGSKRMHFTSTVFDNDTIMYLLNTDDIIFASSDAGQTWEERDTIPDTPWSVGMYVTKTDPNILYVGDNECYTSTNGGNSWVKLADWWNYYDNVQYAIHADMMQFNEFETTAGERFMLISNDGGLSISNDDYYNLATGYENIGLEKLNISQYYDVRSDLDDEPFFIYAGSQDQGFQRGFTNFSNEGVLDFEQVISGDYGHISFSLNGQRMWMVYPGGIISYYPDPQNFGRSARYEIDSNDESVWIPPMMDAPDLNENYVVVAGGSATGGSGGYLIKMEREQGPGNTDEIVATNLPFDFLTQGTGVPTAVASSKIDFDRWYVATEGGGFFTSEDAGQTWNMATQSVPNGHYLYGQAIHPSKVDLQTVYMAGSGYSNAPVLKSTDGGANFVEMSEGMPATLVYDFTANADESLLFAATEAGPFVYVVAEEKWYDMSGSCAPAQKYWSVEYLAGDNLVRFGTYGRGIWDFQIMGEEVSTRNLGKADFDFSAYPNPSSGIVNLEWAAAENGDVRAQVFDVSGKLVFEKLLRNNLSAEQAGNAFTNNEILDLSGIEVGNYFLKIETEEKVGVEKIVVVR